MTGHVNESLIFFFLNTGRKADGQSVFLHRDKNRWRENATP